MADWSAIKTEYITTKTSYRKLAEKYGLNKDTIASRARNEGWKEARQTHTDRTQRRAIQKAEDKEVDRLARLIEATTKAIDVAMEAFEDEQQFNRYLIEKKERYAVPAIEEDGETAIAERQWVEEQTFSKVDTKALKDLTGVLKDLTGLMREFYNIPTPAQAEAQRIAAERLEMEKRKEAADRQDGSEAVEVVFEGAEVEEWSG